MRREQEDEEPDPADLEEERISRRGADAPPEPPCPHSFITAAVCPVCQMIARVRIDARA